MRCTYCRSYIPEGLSEPISCPNCGKTQNSIREPLKISPAEEPEFKPELKAEFKAEKKPQPITPSSAFAPYFTIRTKLSFGLKSLNTPPSFGSISFGPEGVSIVWQEGKRWEKLYYRELGSAKVFQDSVLVDVKGIETKITLYHPWLPDWVKSARHHRAITFVELLGKVKEGLTSTEISKYQRKLATA